MKNVDKISKSRKLSKKVKKTDMAAVSEASYQRSDRISREDRNALPNEDLSQEKLLKKAP